MVRRSVLYGVLGIVVSGGVLTAAEPYQFRRSRAYMTLADEDRIKLEIVHRDFLMLWGALDMYADQNGGQCPRALKSLVPDYLLELPRDPFATDETAKGNVPPGYKSSVNGLGYLYKRGVEGNRAWCLASVGMPTFPYYTAGGQAGLYLCKGTWINGKNSVAEQGSAGSSPEEGVYSSLFPHAVSIAQSWLVLLDKGQYQEGWEAGSFYFRVMIPFDRWVKIVQSTRKENGDVISRKVHDTERVSSLPGAPEGDYIIVTFRTDYWNKKNAVETVVTTRDSDGIWRVSGYTIE